MQYLCRICKSNEVPVEGGVCEDCIYMQDPFASPDPYATPVGLEVQSKPKDVLLLDEQDNPVMPLPTTPDAPKVSVQSAPKTIRGIAKNISYDEQPRAMMSKWFASVRYGAPFAFDAKMLSFQLFPDYGESIACDQVVFYGNVYKGAVNENNTIEITGARDFNHVIVASKLHNVSSNSIVRPTGAIPGEVMRLITLLILCFFVPFCCMFPIQGAVVGAVLLLLLTDLPPAIKVFASLFVALFLGMCAML